MKNAKLLLIALLIVSSYSLIAQVSITTDGTDPDGSAMLDVQSTDKGVLIPRMTTADREDINLPATGLMVYQTDQSAGFYYFDGIQWVYLNETHTDAGYLLAPFSTSSNTPICENSWSQVADFSSETRQRAVAFTIGDRAFAGMGTDYITYSKDFYEYLPETNTWTQIATYPGAATRGAVAFTLNGKGYVGTGGALSSLEKDFWEYDPGLNTWTKKSDFGGTARLDAVAFTYNGKAYVGTGSDGSYKKDLWEYDPLDVSNGYDANGNPNGKWTQKADFIGDERYGATVFTLDTKAYVGAGFGNASEYYKDFYEFDPIADSWAQIADIGGATRLGPVAFVLNGKAYAGLGHSSNDIWEYSPSSNTWTEKANFTGGQRSNAVAFTLKGKAYVGTGFNSGSSKKDFYEYCDVEYGTDNWSSAFTWGDHASAGYLTDETDPKVSSATTNSVPKWSDSTLVDGIIADDGANVGIGVPVPSEKLDVAGAIKLGTTTNTNTGAMRWTGEDFEGYDGYEWLSLTQAEMLKSGTMIGPAPTNGTAVLDAHNGGGNYFSFGQNIGVWQSFTAENSGWLTVIDLDYYINPINGGKLRVYSGEGTSGTLLTEELIDGTIPGVPGGYMTLTEAIAVNAGLQYTIWVMDTIDNFNWLVNVSNSYPGGRASKNASYDFRFNTYVIPQAQMISIDTISGFISLGNDCIIIDQSCNVGIGTVTPVHPLEMGSGAHVTSAGVWTNASDIAKKYDITELTYGLETLLQMNPKSYRYKADDSRSIGFIAQELEKIIPEVVSGEDGQKGVAYGLLTSVIINAMQEQQKEIEMLKAENAEMKVANAKMKMKADRIESMETELAEIKAILGLRAEK